MGDMSKYMLCAVNIKTRNDRPGRIYVSFGDFCSVQRHVLANLLYLLAEFLFYESRLRICRRCVDDDMDNFSHHNIACT